MSEEAGGCLGETVDLAEAIRQLREAAAARKCWTCGCLHTSLDALDAAMPESERPGELNDAIREARLRLAPVRYDCLGCEVCHPPLALNALQVGAAACPAESAAERDGWPPLPGNYRALRYTAPVAVCTLTDEALTDSIARAAPPGVAIVGSLHTENLGIERIIRNVLRDPNIRFLVLAGEDSRQAVGHLPGQSLLALAANGADERGRILGAKGRRPLLRNVGPRAIDHFRRTIEVIDRIGTSDATAVLAEARRAADADPGPAEPFDAGHLTAVRRGRLPERMAPDPAGYFVVYADARRWLLVLEHYRVDGVLDSIIEGGSAAEVYTPAVESGHVSRLDHAAYLGRELARAEAALASGAKYVQDAAPERAALAEAKRSCGCGPECS